MELPKNIKCVIVGDGVTGKTCLVETLLRGVFPTEYIPTVFDTLNVIKTVDNCNINVSFWDTPGQKSYDRLRVLSYPQTDVVVITFSLAIPSSLTSVNIKWYPEVSVHCAGKPIILVGTQSDRRIDYSYANRGTTLSKVIDYKKGLEMAKQIGAVKYLECSAVMQIGLDELYDEICRAAISHRKRSGKKCWLPEPDILSLLHSIKTWSGNIEELDGAIVEYINNDVYNSWFNNFNDEHFRLCFMYGLNKVLFVILQSTQGNKYARNFAFVKENVVRGNVDYRSRNQGSFQTPLLMENFNANENVLIGVLNRYHKEVSSALNVIIPETEENLLHILLKKGLQKAVMVLAENYDVKNLLFHQNSAGNLPFMIAVTQGNINDLTNGDNDEDNTNEDFNVAITLWKHMLLVSHNKEIDDVLSLLNSKRKNILHICTDNYMNKLFVDICTQPAIDRHKIQSALNQPNADGLTPLDSCADEKTILKIMDIVPQFDFDINHVDVKENNVLHINAKKNFSSTLIRLLKSIPDEETMRHLLLHKNKNGNNPLMACVFKNSNDALNVLLCTLFTMSYDKKNDALIKKILHERNTKGDTLLGLILHYQKGMTLSQTIALQMEKNCHTEADNKSTTLANLTECLREHVDPSIEVLNALEDVEESYEKSTTEKIISQIKLFISSCLTPLTVMIADMTFDMILVINYSNYLFKEDDEVPLTNTTDFCKDMGNSTLPTKESLQPFPDKLNGKPRFFYSLGFLFIPWLFYFVEYCHSRHRAQLIQKVHEIMANLGNQGTCKGCITRAFKIGLCFVTAGLTIILWPFLMLFNRFKSSWKSAAATPQTKFNMQARTNQDLVVSARAQIIEVAIESSFQPLLQLYILLPMLLNLFVCYSHKNILRSRSMYEEFESIQWYQFLSILTSIISLAWSFTFYQSIKKKGALDFEANTTGRMMLLIANLLQITTRLFSLIIYAYLFGEGNFWPMIVSVMIHICYNVKLKGNTHELQKKIQLLKNNAKKAINTEFNAEFSCKTKELLVQGKFLELLDIEKQNITWKSYMYSIPRGVLAWASRAITDSLATPANLARWSKIVDPTCKLCANGDQKTKGTLHHILNNCTKMLDRYQWRHDSVLYYLTKTLKSYAPNDTKVFADLENHSINGGTIPCNFIVTNQRPDLVLIKERNEKDEITLIELTIPFENNFDSAAERKENRYAGLISDLNEKGVNADLITLEIGSRGHINARNKLKLKSILKKFKIIRSKELIRNVSKIALLGSYAIYHSRQTPTWTNVPYLCP